MNLKWLMELMARITLSSAIFYFLATMAIDLTNQKAVLIAAFFWIFSLVICAFVPELFKKAAPKK